MKRAALYARYSSDLQSAKSCDDQLAMLREEAAKRGWKIVREYRDDAVSGFSMIGRAGVNQLMSDAGAGAFDIVMCEALDRLARDLADTETLRKRLAFYGIDIVTPSIEKVTMMHAALDGLYSGMFLERLTEKTHRGLAGVIDDGRSAGGTPYGYAPVKGEPGVLAIVEEQAAIVRRILSEYADNESPRAIVRRLNAEGVPGPRGRGWSTSTINGEAKLGHGIIHNELYIGMRVWNRQRRRKDPMTGRALMFDNPVSEWKRVAVPELRIVDDELWARVRDRKRHVGGGGHAKRPVRLFSGLLTCAVCGGGMSIVGPNSYGCSRRAQKGTCENARTIGEREVTERVLDGLRAGLLSPDAQRNAARAFHAEMARLQETASAKTRDLARDIAELERRIDRGLDAILEGGAPAGLGEKLRGMEAERDAKRATLAAIEAQNVVRLHPGAGNLYADAVARLSEILRAGATDAAALRQLIRGIVGQVTMTPRQHGRGYDMRIAGDLAALLTAQTQKPPLGGAGVLSVTNPATHKGMVGAGIGFEPMTFRL